MSSNKKLNPNGERAQATEAMESTPISGKDHEYQADGDHRPRPVAATDEDARSDGGSQTGAEPRREHFPRRDGRLLEGAIVVRHHARDEAGLIPRVERRPQRGAELGIGAMIEQFGILHFLLLPVFQQRAQTAAPVKYL